MVSSAHKAARLDLAALDLPQGLLKDQFYAYAIGTLRCTPLFQRIDELAADGLTDAQAYDFLREQYAGGLSLSVEQHWKTLKAWISVFFGGAYRLEVGQEVLVKGQRLQGSGKFTR
ncbi:hypothetical protein SAMN04488061_3356 [Filomicrobium insigne]|uniref:Uncharacterized protein n=2 Tax=Filomicrobium insigne TaxID=418854 RepID=A0A1H0TSK6_9HYPH|nr:hypothetical protein SAMN04488061_3356 [Filomicrobium insigne]